MSIKGMRKSSTKGLSLEEVQYLREQIKNYCQKPHKRKKYFMRDRTLFELLLNSGLRRGEVANLKVKDLFLDSVHPNILVKTLKNDTSRQVFIPDHLKKILQDYLEWREKIFGNGSDYLFLSERKTPLSNQAIAYHIRKFLEDANLYTPLKSTHCLRHFFATLLFESSKNLRLTQQQMGHKDVSTTQEYTYVTQKEVLRGVKEFDNVLNKD